MTGPTDEQQGRDAFEHWFDAQCLKLANIATPRLISGPALATKFLLHSYNVLRNGVSKEEAIDFLAKAVAALRDRKGPEDDDETRMH